MVFEVRAADGRWFVSNGSVLFGPYRTREKADDSAGSLNLRTRAPTRPAAATAREGGGA